MELSIKERLLLSGVLPQQGNIATLKIVRQLKEDLSFSEEEFKEINLQKSGEDGFRWDKDISKDIQIGEKAVWTPYESYTGIVDLHRVWPQSWQGHHVVAYAWAQIDMPEDTTAVLGIGHDDAAKVWLNGELVHSEWDHHGTFPDYHRIKVNFKKGANQLVIRVHNWRLRWGLCCRLLE